MPKDDMIEVKGKVLNLYLTPCSGRTGNGHKILGHVSGKMRMHFIRILPGIGSSSGYPYDLTRGRIVYRYK